MSTINASNILLFYIDKRTKDEKNWFHIVSIGVEWVIGSELVVLDIAVLLFFFLLFLREIIKWFQLFFLVVVYFIGQLGTLYCCLAGKK